MLAVIISGALRTFDEIWSENHRFIESIGLPYRIFIHTWDQDFKTNRKVYKDKKFGGFAISIQPKEYSGKSRFIDLEYVRKIVPGASILIETFHTQKTVEDLGIPSDSNNPFYQNMINSVGMYMGISRGFQMALNDPEASKFTSYLRIRSDFQIHKEISKSNLEADIYFCGPVVDSGYGRVSDQCFFVKPEIASEIAALECNLSDHVKRNGWGIDSKLPFYGERILSFFLMSRTELFDSLYSPTIGEIKRPKIQPIQGRGRISWIHEIIKFNFSIVNNRFKFLIERVSQYFK